MRYAELGIWDLAACAEALGGIGWCVRTRAQLAAALEFAARTRESFHLLDVRLEPGTVSEPLIRFAGARNRPAFAA